jgi:hypothetical protein
MCPSRLGNGVLFVNKQPTNRPTARQANEGEGCLPLEGSIPDMTATTE